MNMKPVLAVLFVLMLAFCVVHASPIQDPQLESQQLDLDIVKTEINGRLGGIYFAGGPRRRTRRPPRIPRT